MNASNLSMTSPTSLTQERGEVTRMEESDANCLLKGQVLTRCLTPAVRRRDDDADRSDVVGDVCCCLWVSARKKVTAWFKDT